MTKYVNVKVPVRTQEALYEETFNLLSEYATDRWVDNTYVIEFDDTVPASLMCELSAITDTYPHDTLIISGNSVTFVCLGGHTVSSIMFIVNITKNNWRHKAKTILHKLNMDEDVTDDALKSAYVISVLSGGSVRECWTPTIISESIPDALQPVV